ncbi:IclR family transcriptional regulator [Sinirhodobacter sp. WL0062]|uniref:IclR family transcriptional regulator n=2 Tax=Rhodobacterales TaxID=204455 RepID=A0ABS8Z2W2_9RHOB|nr:MULTISPECIES: IclR family transcriptional regulator [Rhodobacterales]MBN8188779.1 IclR family transcriptional regulator [Salipiger thiooxidans]MCE5975094.1 IclR family transcriptional regulator [Sinirhodobacter sp. WL0062]
MEHHDPRMATTLARGLSVLRAFRTNDNGLTNAELAARCGLPKSTISRLTWTLRELGYLTRAEGEDRFRPGPSLVAVGHVAASSLSFIEPADGVMSALADRTGTLVLLAVRNFDRMIVLRTWKPKDVYSRWMEVGHRLPLQQRSTALAFAGALSSTEFSAIDQKLQSLGGSPLLHEEYQQARAELRERGFILNSGETEPTRTYRSASVPFRATELDEPVVFSCGEPISNSSVAHFEKEVGPALREAVQNLERLTGQMPKFDYED